MPGDLVNQCSLDPKVPLKITLEYIINSQNTCRRVVGLILINISPSNIFLLSYFLAKLLLLERYNHSWAVLGITGVKGSNVSCPRESHLFGKLIQVPQVIVHCFNLLDVSVRQKRAHLCEKQHIKVSQVTYYSFDLLVTVHQQRAPLV